MNKLNDNQLAMRVSINSIIVNVLLSIIKLIAGIIAHSGAMISDAVHSASDVFSTFIVILGIRISKKDSDKNHQYGHERFECIASIILSVTLFATGLGIGYSGINKIIVSSYSYLEVPGIFALIVALTSIVTKELMYWYTRNAAKKINSGALMADAWHHRSDALSSVGSFAGIFGARMGYPILDPIASIIICLFIIKASYDIFMDAINKLVDSSCDDEIIQQMTELILNEDGVLTLDEIKTRVFGSKIYVDIEIGADGKQTLEFTHSIAEKVHSKIEENFPNVKHCMVHVNPKSINIDIP